jgi:hypothetical protein
MSVTTFFNASPTLFKYASAIAVSPAGYIYVQGTDNHGGQLSSNIFIYNLSGTYINAITSSETYYHFAVNYSNNKIYGAGNNNFGTIDASTNTLTNISYTSVGGTTLYCLAISTNGFIYATTRAGYVIKRVTIATGAQTTIFTGTPGTNIISDPYQTFGGITFDRTGKIYTITRGGYIYTLDTSGTLLGLFNSTTITTYSFGLTYDLKNDYLYTNSTLGNGVIYQISAKTKNITGYISGNLYIAFGHIPCYGLFYDNTRNMLVATGNAVTNTIYISYQTNVVDYKFTPTNAPADVVVIGVAPNGDIYVAGGSYNIYVYSNSGTYIKTISTPDFPGEFIFDSPNNVFYCTSVSSFFAMYISTGTLKATYSSIWLNGGVLSTDGYIYATTNTGYIIQKVNPSDGTQTNIFTSSNNNIAADTHGNFGHCAFDSNEYIYCITRGVGNIYKFAKDGTLLGLIATTGGAYGQLFGIACDTTTDILYASSVGTPAALYKIRDGVSEVYSISDGPTYSVFYDKITKKLYLPMRASETVLRINPVQLPPSSYSVNNRSIFYYYPFTADILNYASGTGVSDISASSGVVISNGSLLLPGTSTQSVQLLKSVKLLATGITVSFWMKCVTIPTNNACVFLLGDGATGNNFYLNLNAKGAFQLNFGSTFNSVVGYAATQFYLNFTLGDSNWHHYIITINSSSLLSFYVDGFSVQGISNNSGFGSYGPYTHPKPTTLNANYIGRNPFYTTTGYLNAYINQFFVFNRALTSSEIAVLTSANKYINLTNTINDSYSITPSSFTYGSTSDVRFAYSNQVLNPTGTYSLYNGSTALTSTTYTGLYSISTLLGNPCAADSNGNVWVYNIAPSGKYGFTVIKNNLTGIKYYITFPGNLTTLLPSRVRYYNGFIYYIGCSITTGPGYFGVFDPTDPSNVLTTDLATGIAKPLFWGTNYYHSDFDIANDGHAYAIAASDGTSSDISANKWAVDKINLQTYAVTRIINGTPMMFEGTTTNGTSNFLYSMALDSDYNIIIVTKGGFFTKWSRAGVNLLPPLQIADPYSSVIFSNFKFDCYRATNTLYCQGFLTVNAVSASTFTKPTVFVGYPAYSTNTITVDNDMGRLYVSGMRYDLNTNPTIYFNARMTNITNLTFQVKDSSDNVLSNAMEIIGSIIYPCFLQGSKILRLDPETDEEEYIAVEKLRKGDIIRTATCGYKAVAFIGKATLKRPADDPDRKNRIYKFQDKQKRHPPLFITGEHCLLYREKDISREKRREVRDYMGDDYITEIYHRIPAFLDDSGEPYIGSGPVTIWHFALEHNNLYNNYAVYANGILVETCSIDFLMNRSNMELV